MATRPEKKAIAAIGSSSAKPGPSEVLHFLESKARRKQIPNDAARQRSMALRQLVSVLTEDEPRELHWVLDNLEDIARRWATQNAEAKGQTSRTYLSRARSCISDYLAWRQDPSGWTFRQRKSPQRKVRASVKKAETRHLPLGDGADFEFMLPARALTMADVARITHHLASFAQDFDPNYGEHGIDLVDQK
ncbi:MAG TPA: hypothetical protein PKA88_23280 [Polyangiaceae bacterium]|nr:hypothetical protein [Polyangiaceae bacterium]